MTTRCWTSSTHCLARPLKLILASLAGLDELSVISFVDASLALSRCHFILRCCHPPASRLRYLWFYLVAVQQLKILCLEVSFSVLRNSLLCLIYWPPGETQPEKSCSGQIAESSPPFHFKGSLNDWMFMLSCRSLPDSQGNLRVSGSLRTFQKKPFHQTSGLQISLKMVFISSICVMFYFRDFRSPTKSAYSLFIGFGDDCRCWVRPWRSSSSVRYQTFSCTFSLSVAFS